jgi:hypothetical protein
MPLIQVRVIMRSHPHRLAWADRLCSGPSGALRTLDTQHVSNRVSKMR